jgi:hypothetical protein
MELLIILFTLLIHDICLNKLTHNNIITIPDGDNNRTKFFTEYNEFVIIKISLFDNTVTTINIKNIKDKLQAIHSKLNIKYGTFNEELPEQKTAVRYLSGNEKVLEIGANIGRNSLIIANLRK